MADPVKGAKSRYLGKRTRFELWRRRVFPTRWQPYQICVPWQPVAPDGPYKAWRWLGREWLKRPWAEGRTRETYMRHRAEHPEIFGEADRG